MISLNNFAQKFKHQKSKQTNIHICFAKNFQPFFIVMSGQYPGCQRLFMHSLQFLSRLCSDTPTPKYSSICSQKKFSGTRDMYAKTCMSYKNWNDFFFFLFQAQACRRSSLYCFTSANYILCLTLKSVKMMMMLTWRLYLALKMTFSNVNNIIMKCLIAVIIGPNDLPLLLHCR